MLFRSTQTLVRSKSIFLICQWMLIHGALASAPVDLSPKIETSPFMLETFWIGQNGEQKALDSWTTDLKKFKKSVQNEKDPQTGNIVRWQGVLLSSVVDSLVGELSVERRAHIDLVILTGANGSKATIPRSVINRYPLMLANRWKSSLSSKDPRGPIFSIVPWTSTPKILKEDLPLANFFVPQVQRIELTSYTDQFKPYFLMRRTDPSAMRGEKLFVQNCVGCHTSNPGQPTQKLQYLDPHKVQQLTVAGHEGKTSLGIKSQMWTFIQRYLKAYQAERPTGTQALAPHRD